MNNLKKRLDTYVGETPRLTDSLENKIIREISAMEKKKRQQTMFSKVRMSMVFAVVVAVAAVFILSIVIRSDSFLPTETANGTDPNETVIKKVLELQFDGVDERLNELLKPEYRMVINGKEELPEFEKYIDEKYGPYFTEEGLDVFITAYGGTTYPILAYEFGYQLSFKDVSIEQNEQHPNRYTFTATIGYQKDDGEEEIAEVKGIVLFSTKEEGKIGKFQYSGDSGLTDILRK